jgi:GNAT superfamily N-acetyltransferase
VARPSAELRVEQVGFGHPDAMRLIEAVQGEYVLRYGGRDDTPLDPLMFEPPAGSFFVGYLGDEPVVSGAWRRRDDVEAFGSTDAAEIKRMYVVPEVRGAGHARAILAHLEHTAAEAGAEVMILETGDEQPEAISLYESSGYTRIPSFGHYQWSPKNRCFAKPLQPFR